MSLGSCGSVWFRRAHWADRVNELRCIVSGLKCDLESAKRLWKWGQDATRLCGVVKKAHPIGQIEISYTNDRIAINGLERQSSLLFVYLARRKGRKGEQIKVFLVVQCLAPKDALNAGKRLTNVISLRSWRFGPSMDQIMRKRTDSSSPLVEDFFTSSMSLITGFVKCCHSELLSCGVWG